MFLCKQKQKTKNDLQTRALYSLEGLLQYKANVHCILEGSVCAIYNAAQSHLNSLDELQRRLWRRLGSPSPKHFYEKAAWLH